jgi:hypothetical protein
MPAFNEHVTVDALAVAESPLVVEIAVIVVVTLLASATPPTRKWNVDAVFAPEVSPAQPCAALNTNAWPVAAAALFANVTVVGLTTSPAGSGPSVRTIGYVVFVPPFTVMVTGLAGPVVDVLQVMVVAVVAVSDNPAACRRPVQSVGASTARSIPDRWNIDFFCIILLSLNFLTASCRAPNLRGSLQSVSDESGG